MRLKKSRFVQRTNWTRKSRKEETKFRETSAEWNRKRSNLDKKLEAIEKREAGFTAKEEELNKQKAEITKLHDRACTGTRKNLRT